MSKPKNLSQSSDGSNEANEPSDENPPPLALRWTGLLLKEPAPDGVPNFSEDVGDSIERYDGGFLVISADNGRRCWFPDSKVANATWEEVSDE